MQKIVFNIRRFHPEKDEKPYYQEFVLDIEPGTTILDALHTIKATRDQTLGMRFSCRMGVCGSCAMLINGSPGLACNTQVLHVSNRRLTLAPLPNFDIVKDLVPDLRPLFEKHTSVQPFIKRDDREEMQNPSAEFYQSPEDLVDYLQFAYCIKCGACLAACPTCATNPEYLGPMALAQAFRYSSDTRDGGFADRAAVCGAEYGAFNCHYAGECSRVCPKGVDPARAIQLLKQRLVLDYLKLRKTGKPCGLYQRPKDIRRREEIPHPPEYTVSK
jgi:succinate dehydrogenase / fumarate reductase iron-sulfur subunit